MASSGNQVGTIRDYLNNSNIPTANKSRYNKETYWENKTVKNILKNKVYIGTTVQNKSHNSLLLYQPEGISMALPMKKGGMKIYKIMIYVILSGIATGIGALIGVIIGKISQKIIAICLSFAAGAMLYIVSGELIPESNKLYEGRIVALGNIIGIIIGIVVTKI